jgi:uncharacterized protein
MSNQPVPLRVQEAILKVASRCNLNCSYCYVYNKGDESWRDQPRVMSRDVVDALMIRVRNHCARHGLDSFTFHFHGGEPLLSGQQFFVDFVAAARRALEPGIKPLFRMQTNGTLLNDEWCRLLSGLNIGVGISIDGPEEVNDRHRVDHAGRGSYRDVRAGIAAALRGAVGTRRLPGILTVIDLDTDPVAVYEHVKELQVPVADFLLPDSTVDQPPPGFGRSETPYADWLLRIFDRWFTEKPVTVRIRIFEVLVAQILGFQRNVDFMGAGANELLFIETNGAIVPSVTLTVCAPGMTNIGANVLTHELDDVLRNDLVQLYHLSGQRLCDQCSACPVRALCGGGYLPHRYSARNGFANPSIYCADLMKLITHIQRAVADALPPEERRRLGLDDVLAYEAARRLLPAAPEASPRLGTSSAPLADELSGPRSPARRASLPLIA